MKELITYRTLNDATQVGELKAFFEEAGIEHEIENNVLRFDPSFAHNTFGKQYIVKIAREDFDATDKWMQEAAAVVISTLDEDYYLFGFSEEELIEILRKPDEWSEIDIELAKKLLDEKGINFGQEEIEKLKETRIKELAQPEESQPIWIIIGYVLCFLGGFMGIIIGWELVVRKKTLPNGERMYSHSEKDRTHGKNMLMIGAIIFALAIARIVIQKT